MSHAGLINLHYSMLFSMFGLDYCYLPFELADTAMTAKHHIILITVRGEGSLTIDEASLNMKHSRGYLIPPGSAYRIRPGKEGVSYYRVLFGMLRLGEDGSTAGEEVIPERILRPGELNCQPFSQCIDRLEVLYQMRDCRDELELFEQQIRFQEWLRFIFRQNGLAGTERDMRQAVEASIQHIKQNYQDSLTVDYLATQANITRWQYTRLFKEMTGKVPLEYINDFRMDRAKQQLLISEDRLFEIAQNVGFNNEYYFNRRFKKSVGVSPGQYRRSYRGKKRVFAPFLEDFLVALGVTPLIQCTQAEWGKQEYLKLANVPVFDIGAGDMEALSSHKPDIIIMDGGFSRWIASDVLGSLAPMYSLSHPGEDWRSTLETVAELLDCRSKVVDIIGDYEQRSDKARKLLKPLLHRQSVAFLRISALGISLYGGEDHGYTGPILYRDLGLTPPLLVKKLTRDSRKVLLEPQELVELDADHLFITFDKRHSTREREEREILNSPLWQSLRVVKGGYVYEVDFYTWMNYGILSHRQKIDDVLAALTSG